MNKKFAFLLTGAIFMAACGNSDQNKATENKDTSAAATGSSTAPVNSDKGLTLIGASDCTTCHSLHKGSGAAIGPAYEDVAAKYNPASDSTVNMLVSKVIKGGSGVWGTVPMTPHPALQDSDVRTMVTYILSLKKS